MDVERSEASVRTATDRDGSGTTEGEPALRPPITSASTVSVTIVNHCARELLKKCLDALRRHPYSAGPMEIVVLDNGSDDGSIEMLQAEFPEVHVLAERRRRGFGANQNLAIAASSGELVLMLNPDAEVHDGTVDRLAAAVAESPTLGAAGGPTANRDGSWRQSELNTFPRPSSPLRRVLHLLRLQRSSRSTAQSTDDGWPSGGACMVRRSAFDKVGGFDEAFFMYAEDADLFRRLADAGYKVAWVDNAIVTHPYPDDTTELSRRRETENMRAELQYMCKHFGRKQAALYRFGMVVDAGLHVVAFSIPGLNRQAQTHGKGLAYHRRAYAGRMTAALLPLSRGGMREQAEAWNATHAIASGASLAPPA